MAVSSEWKGNVEMMILNIEINNPDSPSSKADIARKLAEKDTNAVKRQLEVSSKKSKYLLLVKNG